MVGPFFYWGPLDREMNLSSADISLAASSQPAVASVIAQPAAAHNGFTAVNPLEHADWDSLLSGHSESAFFHTSAWARVLNHTYGHRPFYFCRITASRLQALLATMEVSSWCTGLRGVALPFTDECPLVTTLPGDRGIYDAALELGRSRNWRYLECRHDAHNWPNAQPSVSFYHHIIQLEQEPDLMFKRLASALRRGIRKASEEGLEIEFNSQPESLSLYYSLHCRTRRKHGVPPQPFRFFQNIGRYVLAAGHGFVAIARWQHQPIAAAVFFHNGRQAIYKFGASDYRFQHVRPNNLLMWEAMKRCAAAGCSSLHLGRTSLANEGLRRFKLSFGSEEFTRSYAKYDFRRGAFVGDVDRAQGRLNQVFRCLPAPLFRLAGRVLYPHLS